MDGYIDNGARVRIVGNANVLGSDDLTEYQEQTGVVVSNDGWGLCLVDLDSGQSVMAWNGSDLARDDLSAVSSPERSER